MGAVVRKEADFTNRHIFCLSVCLCHLPVRMDWSTRRVVDLMEMILMSAGTLSPTSVHTNTNTHTEIHKKNQKSDYSIEPADFK